VVEATLKDGYEYIGDFDDDQDDDEDGGGGGSAIINKLLAPDTGVGKAMGWLVLGEVAFVAAGLAVFFRLRKR